MSRFVLLYGGVVIFLIYLIWRGRRRPKPTQFDFGPRKLDQHPSRPRERELNCFFDFRGENLDAFDVLGVPAGASDDVIHAGFRRSLARADGENGRSKVEAAFNALKSQRGSL